MKASPNRASLGRTINDWLEEVQRGDDVLDMYLSDTISQAMANAAWEVLEEARNTQRWLEREGHIKE